MLPYPYEKCVKYDKFNDALNGFEIIDDSITFFYLPDLHYMMDTNGYNMKMMYKGTNIAVNCIESILDKFGMDCFDYILIFSDHGFRIGMKEHLIDNDRVRTLMFLHKKGDTGIKKDLQIRSNLDVFPTIMDMMGINIEGDVDGKSLLGEGHDYLLLEDHENFSVKLGQTIEHWAVIKEDGKHWLECDGKWKHENIEDGFDETYWKKVIASKMDDYTENSRLWKILHAYDNNKIENNTYTNGEPIAIRLTNKGIFKKVKWLYNGIRYAMRKTYE